MSLQSPEALADEAAQEADTYFGRDVAPARVNAD
jgi:hypothetical protein